MRNPPGLLCHLPGHHCGDGLPDVALSILGLFVLISERFKLGVLLVSLLLLFFGLAHADQSSRWLILPRLPTMNSRFWRKPPNSFP